MNPRRFLIFPIRFLPPWSSCTDRRALTVSLLLGAIVLLGALLRVWQATETVWLDELHTSWVVAESWGQVADRARAGNQSPLYFYLVWGLVQLFGHYEWVLRLPSLSAGLILIPAIFLLVRNWTAAASSGLVAALLVACDRNCVFYAQEARPYALVQLLALLHAGLFLAVLVKPTLVRRSFLVVGAALLFHLHYTAFLFLVAEGVAAFSFIVSRRTPVSYRWSQFLIDVVLIAALITPSATHLLVIAENRSNWSRIVASWPPARSLQIAAWCLVAIPAVALAIGSGLRLRPASWSAGRHGIAPGPGDGSRSDVSRHSSGLFGEGVRGYSRRSLVWAFVVCWFLVPTAIAWLSTVSGLAALCMMRYLVASLVGSIVFATLCHAAYAQARYRWIVGGLLVAATVFSSGMLQQWSYDGRWIGDRSESWDTALTWLQKEWESRPGPVLLFPGLLEDRALQGSSKHGSSNRELVDYCLFPVRGIYRLDVADVIPLATSADVQLNPGQLKQVHQAGRVWLLIRARPIPTERIASSVVQALTQDGIRPQIRRQRFGKLTVFELSTATALHPPDQPAAAVHLDNR